MTTPVDSSEFTMDSPYMTMDGGHPKHKKDSPAHDGFGRSVVPRNVTLERKMLARRGHTMR